MAGSLGKRKRERKTDESDDGDQEEGALRSLFQRAFEAKFKPLERTAPVLETETVEEDDFEESDWSGISEDEQDDIVDTHEHTLSYLTDQDAERQEKKSFMTSKPPSSIPASKSNTLKSKASSEDDPTEATNLKHDLALQRLLRESHLLEPEAFSTKTPEVSGKSRLKALDLRLKDLGAKKSPLEQRKMPLSHRRGITAKVADREDRRRNDARENGIILERAKHAAKASQTRRVRSVGGPAIGKFRGGTLKLRASDVRSIQGPQKNRKGRSEKGMYQR